MRVALLTLEARAASGAVRRFVAEHPDRIALVAISDPYRPAQGGALGQARRLIGRSGLRILPYLVANFVLPGLADALPRPGAAPERTKLTRLCGRLGIPATVEADMNAPGFHAKLRESGAELIVTFHCDQILSAATIALLPQGGINVHAGLLPDHRGPVPTIHALLEDKPRFGITLHRLVPRIDAGALLAQAAIDLPAQTSALAAAELLHLAAVPMLARLLDAIEAGTERDWSVPPLPYCGFPSPAQLRDLAGRGRRAAGWRDIWRAVRG